MSEKNEKPNREIFIPAFCPYCGASLNVLNDRLKLRLEYANHSGTIFLSALLGAFDKQYKNIFVPEGDIPVFKCPHPWCREVLNTSDACPVCNAPQVRFAARFPGGETEISICSRCGCRWHSFDKSRLFSD